MNPSSKIIFLISLFILFLTTKAFALPVAGDEVLMSASNGVPYTMTVLNGSSVGEIYQSFCLEKDRDFTDNAKYTVDSVGEFATGGGGGATDGKDQISENTKWLYAAYMSDIFSGVTDAALKVQYAIWYLEDEFPDHDHGLRYRHGLDSEKQLANKYWDILKAFDFDDSGWDVVAVNLTSNCNPDAQSQLVGVAPVPEPGTMLLFGTGLVGLAGVSRRKKK